MRKGIYTGIVLLILALSHQVMAVSPGDFARGNQYYSAKVSPDGKYLAVGVLEDTERKLLVLDTQTFKVVGGANLPYPRQVGPFYWVNNERLVIKILQARTWESEPLYYGELFAVNYDGDKAKNIYGYDVIEKAAGSNIRRGTATRGWAEIVHFLPDDEDHILISSTPASKDSSRPPELRKLNIYNGKLSSKIARSPLPAGVFDVDRAGQLRFVTGVTEKGEKQFFSYDAESQEWQTNSDINIGDGFATYSFDANNEHLFYVNDADTDKQGVFKYNLKTGESSKVYVDQKVDITGVAITDDKSAVYGIRIDNGYPEYILFNDQEDDVAVFKSLLATFVGQEVTIVSKSRDEKFWVVFVKSDTSAGTYYLFDRENVAIQILFDVFNAVPKEQMASTQPIWFEASDGVEIPGYLTLPKKASGKVPLVTLVHGGPHGPRDYWGFDPEVQMLANQGYAVLRVNFRGSGGYGQDFEKAGHRQWGDRIQKDIIEGTRWAMALEQVDPEKVCIMGASFGGYSAVQSATLAPELFDCVVATAGVFDLQMMFDEGDIPELFFGESFLEKVLGEDEAELKAFSPVNRVTHLQAPVLIAHGKKDRRVPIEQAEQLRDALEEHDKPYEWFVRSSETHGFFDEDNRAEYFETVAGFLRQYLK
ncbi:alpha/beta hydrolase family protein [Planctobacterium marinum]|uniref:alpha/beta hydrolase family protein n=1 Tax=Planctobacterium marinum TaxID=1631968 RepID=UPI001E461537|nr:S9 family peptidase [Planctobacterium marinum]MCC2608098.1 S9 family peptidase [Planctobacterium marinum]